jgi:hypothetical protein
LTSLDARRRLPTNAREPHFLEKNNVRAVNSRRILCYFRGRLARVCKQSLLNSREAITSLLEIGLSANGRAP